MTIDTSTMNDTSNYLIKSDSLLGLTRSDPDFRSLVKMLNQSRHDSYEPLPTLRDFEPLDPKEITSQVLSEICDDLLEPIMSEGSHVPAASLLSKESEEDRGMLVDRLFEAE